MPEGWPLGRPPARARSRARRSCRAPGGCCQCPWRARARGHRPRRRARPRTIPRRPRRSPPRRTLPPPVRSRSCLERRSRLGRDGRRLRLARKVLDVQQPLEDPLVEARLAQLVAVEDRPDALPPLLEEPKQRGVRLGAIELLHAVQDPGGAVDAEASLAGAHSQAQAAADVVEAVGPPPAHRLLEAAAADELAFADQLLVEQPLLGSMQAGAELVGLALIRIRQRLIGRPAGPRLPELVAHGVYRLLGHEPERRQLAAGDREKATDPVSLGVIEQRVSTRELARVF